MRDFERARAVVIGGTRGIGRAVAQGLVREGVRIVVGARSAAAWVRDHDRRVKAAGAGCHLLVCRLPSKSPWLNPIEPRWAHGKRAVVEPERKLTGAELSQRLCDHYRCQLLPPLAQQVA